jgi:hypothetical protein
MSVVFGSWRLLGAYVITEGRDPSPISLGGGN